MGRVSIERSCHVVVVGWSLSSSSSSSLLYNSPGAQRGSAAFCGCHNRIKNIIIAIIVCLIVVLFRRRTGDGGGAVMAITAGVKTDDKRGRAGSSCFSVRRMEKGSRLFLFYC